MRCDIKRSFQKYCDVLSTSPEKDTSCTFSLYDSIPSIQPINNKIGFGVFSVTENDDTRRMMNERFS